MPSGRSVERQDRRCNHGSHRHCLEPRPEPREGGDRCWRPARWAEGGAGTGGLWLGWSGRISVSPDREPRIQQSAPFTLATVDLSDQEHAGYHGGFANRTLWPLLHGRVDLMRFDTAEWASYRSVNEKFARNLAPLLRLRDLVWVHDYQLMLLGQALRWRGIDAPLGFFLHVPFPAPEVISALPCHEELVRALSAYDLVGFQSENDLRNFREFVSRRLGGTVSDQGTVVACGSSFRVGVFPIGIDAASFGALARSGDVQKLCRYLQPCFDSCLGIVGVDRLDYTKGIAHRLRAFERLLETSPGYRGRTFLLQIAAPARMMVPEYTDLQGRLEAISGRINARHADIDWTPVRFLNRTFSHARIAALFRLSRVGLVTPLSDGMSLVAKEYVAAQPADDPGVLVLSRFAGAAQQLGAALIVNPHDADGVALAIRDALEMPLEERHARWAEMMADLREHDVHYWRNQFLEALRSTRRPNTRVTPRLETCSGSAVSMAGKPAALRWSGHSRPSASSVGPAGTAVPLLGAAR